MHNKRTPADSYFQIKNQQKRTVIESVENAYRILKETEAFIDDMNSCYAREDIVLGRSANKLTSAILTFIEDTLIEIYPLISLVSKIKDKIANRPEFSVERKDSNFSESLWKAIDIAYRSAEKLYAESMRFEKSLQQKNSKSLFHHAVEIESLLLFLRTQYIPAVSKQLEIKIMPDISNTPFQHTPLKETIKIIKEECKNLGNEGIKPLLSYLNTPGSMVDTYIKSLAPESLSPNTIAGRPTYRGNKSQTPKPLLSDLIAERSTYSDNKSQAPKPLFPDLITERSTYRGNKSQAPKPLFPDLITERSTYSDNKSQAPKPLFPDLITERSTYRGNKSQAPKPLFPDLITERSTYRGNKSQAPKPLLSDSSATRTRMDQLLATCTY